MQRAGATPEARGQRRSSGLGEAGLVSGVHREGHGRWHRRQTPAQEGGVNQPDWLGTGTPCSASAPSGSMRQSLTGMKKPGSTSEPNGTIQKYQGGYGSEDHQGVQERGCLQQESLRREKSMQSDETDGEMPPSTCRRYERNQQEERDGMMGETSRPQRLHRKRGRSYETRRVRTWSDEANRADECPEQPWSTASNSPASTATRGLPGSPGFPTPSSRTWTPESRSPGFPSPLSETWSPSSICELPRTPNDSPESSPSWPPTVWYDPELEPGASE